MKKITLLLMFLSAGIVVAQAQKIAHIESQKIMEELDEYRKAMDYIDLKTQEWKDEVEARYKAIEEMYQDYVEAEAQLTKEARQRKQDEIVQAEKQAKQYQEEKFGYEGEIQELQELKISPISEKINNAAQELAKEKGYDYVVDISANMGWIYTNPDYDLTEEVKSKLNSGE